MIRRLGVWQEGRSREVAAELQDRACLHLVEGCAVSKVVVVPNLARRQPATEWIEIDVNHLVDFIRERMNKYREAKFGDRLFFPDPLIQFFAEEVRVARPTVPEARLQ